MFSKACEYAIKAMIFISSKSDGNCVSLKDIAKGTNSPEAFTAKTLQKLSRTEILSSIKGPNGGFFLSQSPSDIMLSEIVIAIDGDALFKGCALGLSECSETSPCPVHDKFKAIKDDLTSMCHNTSLAETSSKLTAGTAFLKTEI